MIAREYDNIRAINNSMLKHLKRSPEHYIWVLNNPPVPTPALPFGIAFHVYVLEQDKFNHDVFIFDELQRPLPKKTFGSTLNKEWKKEVLDLAKNNGQAVITVNQHELIKRMADKLQQTPQAWELIDYTRNSYEVVQQWTCLGVECKSLVDIKNDFFLADLKTTIDADPDQFPRDVFRYDYYRQGGMYIDGDADGNIDLSAQKDFFFIVIEKAPPFGVAVYKCKPNVIAAGVREYRELIVLWKKCVKSNNWPGYDHKSLMGEPFEIELPHWM